MNRACSIHRHELKLAGVVVAWMWERGGLDEVRQPARGAGGPGISVTTSLRICYKQNSTQQRQQLS